MQHISCGPTCGLQNKMSVKIIHNLTNVHLAARREYYSEKSIKKEIQQMK